MSKKEIETPKPTIDINDMLAQKESRNSKPTIDINDMLAQKESKNNTTEEKKDVPKKALNIDDMLSKKKTSIDKKATVSNVSDTLAKKASAILNPESEKNINGHDKVLNISKDEALFLRYKASKMSFIIMALIFFTDSYMVGARFTIGDSLSVLKFAKAIFPFCYVLFVLSIFIFIYYYVQLKFYQRKNAKLLSYISLIGLGLLAVVFLFTFIIDVT